MEVSHILLVSCKIRQGQVECSALWDTVFHRVLYWYITSENLHVQKDAVLLETGPEFLISLCFQRFQRFLS